MTARCRCGAAAPLRAARACTGPPVRPAPVPPVRTARSASPATTAPRINRWPALVRPRHPERLGARWARRAGEDEEQIRQPVDVRERGAVDLRPGRERHHLALRAPAGLRACDVQPRRDRRAARQHERRQRREPLVHLVAARLEPRDLRVVDPQPRPLPGRAAILALLLGHGEVGADVEEVVLDPGQPGRPAVGQPALGEDEPEGGVEAGRRCRTRRGAGRPCAPGARRRGSVSPPSPARVNRRVRLTMPAA